MPVKNPNKSPYLYPIHKTIAELYLRAWIARGEPVRETARRMHVSRDRVARLVESLKLVYIDIPPGYFPPLQVLERFGKALGYDLHISLEETDV